MEQRQLAPAAAPAPDILAPSHNFLHTKEPYTAALFSSSQRNELEYGNKLETPVDEVTGLPLPILALRRHYLFSDIDYHHTFHPKNTIELGRITLEEEGLYDDPVFKQFVHGLRLEGKSVRYSRGQVLPVWIHRRVHEVFYGPRLPATRQEKFATVVLALSGVVPRQAIHMLPHGDYKVTGLTDKQHAFISSRERMHFQDAYGRESQIKRNWIGRFFAEYAMEQSINSIVSEPVIDEFLHSSDQARIKELGNLMLVSAINTSIDELMPMYNEAKSEAMLADKALQPRKVVRSFFTKNRFTDYYDALRSTLQPAEA